jgi:hypothetical protein
LHFLFSLLLWPGQCCWNLDKECVECINFFG